MKEYKNPYEAFVVTISTDKKIEDIIRSKEGDANSRYLAVKLVHDNGIPHDLNGCKVRLNARRYDSKTFFEDGVVEDAENGITLFMLRNEMLLADRKDRELVVDISIFADDERAILTTRTFTIQVEFMTRDDKQTEAGDEFGAVVAVFQDVWDMRQVIQAIDQRFGEKGDDIDMIGDDDGGMDEANLFGKMNRFWNYLKTQSTAAIVEMVGKIVSTLGNYADVGNGTIFSRLNELDGYGKRYVPSDTVQETLYTTAFLTKKGMVLYRGETEYSGRIRVKITTQLDDYRLASAIVVVKSDETVQTSETDGSGNITILYEAPTGTILGYLTPGTSYPVSFHFYTQLRTLRETTFDFIVSTTKGETISVILLNSIGEVTISNLQILYDIKEGM